MPANFLSGKFASVTIGMDTFSFDSWSATMSEKLGKVTNFNSGGFDEYISGIKSAKVTLSGPYDEGNMAFLLGNLYTLILGYTSMITFTLDGVLESIEPDTKVDDPIKMKYVFQSTGTFTAATV